MENGGRDTRIGGPASRFPTTHWSMILGSASEGRRRDRLQRLAAGYWKPVYRYIRARWNASSEEAKDLTQEFFVDLLERGTESAASPDRGRFRTFLKHALKCFLVNERERGEARKRGGGLRAIELEVAQERGLLSAPERDESPEDAFDREWARCALERAMASMREFLARAGKDRYAQAFELRHLSDPPLGYAEIAGRIGRSASDVRNYLTYCRSILKKALRAQAQETTSGGREADEEAAFLLRLSSSSSG